MSSLPSGAEAGWIGPRERISMMTQLRGAFVRLRRAVVPLVVLGLATFVLGVTGQMLASAMKLPLTGLELTPAYVGYIGATTLLTSLFSSMGLRALVRGPERWFLVDVPLVLSTLIFAGFGLAIGLANGFIVRASQGSDSPMMVSAVIAGFVVYVILLYAWLKLVLWPVGVMMQRPEVTPAKSWRLMKKATRGLVLGYVVLGLPVFLIGVFGARFLLESAEGGVLTPIRMALMMAGVVFVYCASGLVATIYDLRVTRAGNVAEVFD